MKHCCMLMPERKAFTMKTNDIVTISDVCADLLLFGDDIMPEFGQKEKLGSRYYLTMGGSCGIFACQAAKLGLKTAVVGTLADDVIGRMLLEKYRESGVITEHLRFADSYTAMSVAHCRVRTARSLRCRAV